MNTGRRLRYGQAGSLVGEFDEQGSDLLRTYLYIHDLTFHELVMGLLADFIEGIATDGQVLGVLGMQRQARLTMEAEASKDNPANEESP